MYHRPLCVIRLISGGFQTIRKKHLFHRTIRQIPMNPPGTPNKKKTGGHWVQDVTTFQKPSPLLHTQRFHQVDSLHRDATIRHTPSVSLARVRSLNNSVMVTCGWDGKPKLGGFHWCNFWSSKWKDLWRRLSRFFLHDSLFMGIVLDWMDFIYYI